MPPPSDLAVEKFIAAVIGGDAGKVTALAVAEPALPRANIRTLAALGEVEGLREALAREPALAKAPGGICRAEPIAYVALGAVGGDDAARVKCAEILLAQGADANATWFDRDWPESRLPALYAATGRNNYPQLARVLLKAGAKTDDGESIYHAAEKNHRGCLEALAGAGADFGRRQQPWGNTPLYFLLGHDPHGAMAGPAGEGIRWLLEHGADPNVASYVDKQNETALHLLVRQGWPAALATTAIAHGADVNRPRLDGRTPLTLALRGGRTELAALLRKHGAQKVATPADRLVGACLRADDNMARALVADHPELLPPRDREDQLAVHQAAREGRAEALALMHELGFDLKVAGEHGETALHLAAWHGRLASLQSLLRAGAAVDAVEGMYRATPLGWCAHGSLNCRNPTGAYGACAAALIAAGAAVPEGLQGSTEVEAALKTPRPG
jgi:ankyrin repeat protein